jgi:hypothetical protein
MAMPLPLSSYRERLEDMTAEVLEEYYAQGAGLKPTLDIAPIYERYAELSTLEQTRALAAPEAPHELYRFACESYVANGVKHLTEEAANTESALTVSFDGEEIPYRDVRPRLVNEPDRERRRELYVRRTAATEEHLNPILLASVLEERRLTQELGAPSVLALYESFGYDPRGLERQTAAFLEETAELYERHIDRALRERVGVPLAEANPSDVARLWRAPEFDRFFARERALPALRATLAGMGIDLDRQRNVELDVEARPGKRPRAFCAPIRVPDRVVLVILPQGGQDDYRSLFHEAGHAEHFAHARRELPVEARVLGDNAVTEGYAFLLEHLVSDQAWLAAQLDFGAADDYVQMSALLKLNLARRYSAKLRYELELQGGAPLEVLPELYAQTLSEATGVAYPPGDYLEDVDGGFYATCYLRAWAFEAQLSDFLQSEFGSDWFRRRAAGDVVRELWSLGQEKRADELLREVTGAGVEFGVLGEEAHRRLRS